MRDNTPRYPRPFVEPAEMVPYFDSVIARAGRKRARGVAQAKAHRRRAEGRSPTPTPSRLARWWWKVKHRTGLPT